MTTQNSNQNSCGVSCFLSRLARKRFFPTFFEQTLNLLKCWNHCKLLLRIPELLIMHLFALPLFFWQEKQIQCEVNTWFSISPFVPRTTELLLSYSELHIFAQSRCQLHWTRNLETYYKLSNIVNPLCPLCSSKLIAIHLVYVFKQYYRLLYHKLYEREFETSFWLIVSPKFRNQFGSEYNNGS